MTRILLFALLGLFVSGCERLDQRGMVLVMEPGYRAEILLTERDGITSPDGLLWADGTLFVADEGGSAIRTWQPGNPVRTLADSRAGLASPEDLVRSADGTLFVSDDDAGGVWALAAGKRAENLVAQPRFRSEGIGLSPAGALLVGDAARHRIVTFAATEHAAQLRLPEVRKPESFAWDAAGRLYIADNEENTLRIVGPDGTLQKEIGDQAGFSPESIHHSGQDLFITDSSHGKLFRYNDREGLKVIALFAGEMGNVQGITSDEQGNLFLSIQSDLERGSGFIVRLSRAHALPRLADAGGTAQVNR